MNNFEFYKNNMELFSEKGFELLCFNNQCSLRKKGNPGDFLEKGFSTAQLAFDFIKKGGELKNNPRPEMDAFLFPNGGTNHRFSTEFIGDVINTSLEFYPRSHRFKTH